MVGTNATYTLPRISYGPTGCVDYWIDTSPIDAPPARNYHTAVWTGSEMIIWGGWNGPGLNTGGRYDPTTDSWTDYQHRQRTHCPANSYCGVDR